MRYNIRRPRIYAFRAREGPVSDTFAQILEIAVYVLMGAVAVVLVLGLGAMYTGGKKSKSNLFMRLLLALLVFVVKK